MSYCTVTVPCLVSWDMINTFRFNYTGQQKFPTQLKICYLEDFFALSFISIFIFLCKKHKTVKNAVKPQ